MTTTTTELFPLKVKTSRVTLDNWRDKEYASWEQSSTFDTPTGAVSYEVKSPTYGSQLYAAMNLYHGVTRGAHVKDILDRRQSQVVVNDMDEALTVLSSGEWNGWWWDTPYPGIQRVTRAVSEAIEAAGFEVLWPSLMYNRSRFEIQPTSTVSV